MGRDENAPFYVGLARKLVREHICKAGFRVSLARKLAFGYLIRVGGLVGGLVSWLGMRI